MQDRRELVAYLTPMGTYNLFREPLGESQPSECTPVKLNMMGYWEVMNYVETYYPAGHRLIHWR